MTLGLNSTFFEIPMEILIAITGNSGCDEHMPGLCGKISQTDRPS